jgi:hypothetical protein
MSNVSNVTLHPIFGSALLLLAFCASAQTTNLVPAGDALVPMMLPRNTANPAAQKKYHAATIKRGATSLLSTAAIEAPTQQFVALSWENPTNSYTCVFGTTNFSEWFIVTNIPLGQTTVALPYDASQPAMFYRAANFIPLWNSQGNYFVTDFPIYTNAP